LAKRPSKAGRKASVNEGEVEAGFGHSTRPKHRQKQQLHMPKNGSFASIGSSPLSYNQDEIFQMSESESEDEEARNTSNAGLINAETRQAESREKLAVTNNANFNPVAEHVKVDEKGHPGGHHPVGSYKHGVHWQHKNDDIGLFPISETDDVVSPNAADVTQPIPLSSTQANNNNDEDQLRFVNSVRSQLRDLQVGNTSQPVAAAARPLSSSSYEMDILSRLGSVRSID
jgi:hypothetical protein